MKNKTKVYVGMDVHKDSVMAVTSGSRSQIPSHADHFGGAEVHSGAGVWGLWTCPAFTDG